MARVLPWLPLLTVACAEARDVSTATLPADGVTSVVCDVQRGGVVLAGTSPTEFVVTQESWGRGLIRSGARAAAADNVGVHRIVDGRLELVGQSDRPRAGVDFVVEGPPEVDVDAVLSDGDLALHDLEGAVVATARSVVGRGLVGSLDLRATEGGVDLEAQPQPGDEIVIDARGDVGLALPKGGPYAIEVWPDPDFAVDVTDLGFDELTVAPDHVYARRGGGSITVVVVVRGGAFSLWDAARGADD